MQIRYVNAGHPSAYVLNHAGDVKQTLQSGSFPLSVLPDAEYRLSDTHTLAPGDIVLLVTDGILEAASPAGELFGAERLLARLRDSRHGYGGRDPRRNFRCRHAIHASPTRSRTTSRQSSSRSLSRSPSG